MASGITELTISVVLFVATTVKNHGRIVLRAVQKWTVIKMEILEILFISIVNFILSSLLLSGIVWLFDIDCQGHVAMALGLIWFAYNARSLWMLVGMYGDDNTGGG